ncbi:GNAT family N-acetyltransferase [Pseudoclavibacter sp. AY1F1]|nr:GNAT family N-acetyltransferase [Pseudoclavibacter sp. AY1F1]
MSIRPAVTADFPALHALWRRSVEATHAFLSRSQLDAIAVDVRGYLPRLSDLRVAAQGDEVAGFIAVEGDTIEALFVDAKAQGCGVGSALLRSVLAGRTTLRVDVNEQNPSGRAFYASRGFIEVGRSELDGEGRPFPLLHLQLTVETSEASETEQ